MPLTRPEIAALALYACGGERESVHTEDVAIKAAEIAPGTFSWEKHPDRIDKELVRVALSDGRIKKDYVLGSHQEGWMLTPVGLAYARGQSGGVIGKVATRKRRNKADQVSTRERARLLESAAFQKFDSGRSDDISDDDADAFFRLNIYVRDQARKRKIARIRNDFGQDPELGQLVEELARIASQRS